jgi:hypothetical protein
MVDGVAWGNYSQEKGTKRNFLCVTVAVEFLENPGEMERTVVQQGVVACKIQLLK